MNSSKPIGLADRVRLLTSVMVVGPAAVAAGKSGRVILQIKQHDDMLHPYRACFQPHTHTHFTIHKFSEY